MRPALAVLLACSLVLSSGCDLSGAPRLEDKRVQGGNAAQGRALISNGRFGCAACHAIPGINSPSGIVGPSLNGIASRSFIAGQLPNKPEVMVTFLRDPPSLVTDTGMPAVGLSAAQARDVAAYLYTLESARAPY